MQFCRFLLIAGGALFDHDDLATPVEAATRTDVVRSRDLAPGGASDTVDRGDEEVTGAIAQPVWAGGLLGKCSHGWSPLLIFVVRPKQ